VFDFKQYQDLRSKMPRSSLRLCCGQHVLWHKACLIPSLPLLLLLLPQTRVGRAYGRVGRRLLREALLKEAAAAGVKYHPGTVEGVDISADGNTASITCSGDMQVTCR
jgi:hypothetical protein